MSVGRFFDPIDQTNSQQSDINSVQALIHFIGIGLMRWKMCTQMIEHLDGTYRYLPMLTNKEQISLSTNHSV